MEGNLHNVIDEVDIIVEDDYADNYDDDPTYYGNFGKREAMGDGEVPLPVLVKLETEDYVAEDTIQGSKICFY